MKQCSLTFLGTGTCQLSAERIASSILIEWENASLLFDIGYGVAHRLASLDKPRNAIPAIYLSHFHPDHIIDLIPFLHEATWTRETPRKEALTVYGPAGTKDMVAKLRGIFSDGSLINDQFPFAVVEVEEDRFSIEGASFQLVDLPPAGNHGLMFEVQGKKIGISGDAGEATSLQAFCRDCDLAIIDIGHLDYEHVIEVLLAAQTPSVIGTHVYHEYCEQSLRKELQAAGFKGHFSIAGDRDVFSLPEHLHHS